MKLLSIGFLIALSLSSEVASSSLRGRSRGLQDDTPADETFTNDSSATGGPTMPISTLSQKTVVKFPEGVFDISKADDITYVRGVQQRCNQAVQNSKNPAEILSCIIYFDNSYTTVPMSLGPLKDGVDLMNSVSDQGYDSSDVNKIFTDNAMAVMIDQGCFIFDVGESGSPKTSDVRYNSTDTYESSFYKENSVAFNIKAGFFGVNLHGGFNRGSKKWDNSNSIKKYWYGKKSFYSNIGLLQNTCLSQSKIDIIVENNLIKAEVIEQWKEVRGSIFDPAPTSLKNYGNIDQSKFTKEFKSIADGGFMIPDTYQYGVSVDYTIVIIDKDASSQVGDITNNSFDIGLGFGNEQFSIDFTLSVKKAVEATLNQTSSSFSVDVESYVKGSDNVMTTCLNTKDKCLNDIATEYNAIKGDINKLGKPINHVGFVSLDDFVSWYFKYNNDPLETGKGFPANFEAAANTYLTYETCEDGKRTFFYGNGNSLSGPYPYSSFDAILGNEEVGYPIYDDACPAFAEIGQQPNYCKLCTCKEAIAYHKDFNFNEGSCE
jgi:hypothetical protein